jgi:lipid II:glycine glycyltransferase (peptidoglycan interpeptide bridge formation enzyme)
MAFVYQSPAGIDAVCRTFELEDASRLYEFSNGRQLVLPLTRRRGRPRWLTIEKSPSIGGFVSRGPVLPSELQAIFADLAGRHTLRTSIYPTALAGETWSNAVPAGLTTIGHRSHILDLQGGFESVWKSKFNRQARRAVRKAEKSSIEIECDTTGKFVPIFHGLLQRSAERWASKTREPSILARWRLNHRDPLERFHVMSEVLGDTCQIWVAYVDGKPAAAIIVLVGQNAHYTRGAMDIELAGPVRASFLLQKLAIEDACNRGCRYYHMGETGTSETLARFKSHFGARAFLFSEYRFERFPYTKAENTLRHFAKSILGGEKK